LPAALMAGRDPASASVARRTSPPALSAGMAVRPQFRQARSPPRALSHPLLRQWLPRQYGLPPGAYYGPACPSILGWAAISVQQPLPSSMHAVKWARWLPPSVAGLPRTGWTTPDSAVPATGPDKS